MFKKYQLLHDFEQLRELQEKQEEEENELMEALVVADQPTAEELFTKKMSAAMVEQKQLNDLMDTYRALKQQLDVKNLHSFRVEFYHLLHSFGV
jgi:hypothetical protein